MKRQELKALLHGVENAGEIIDQIMDLNGADIENAKKNAGTDNSAIVSENEELKSKLKAYEKGGEKYVDPKEIERLKKFELDTQNARKRAEAETAVSEMLSRNKVLPGIIKRELKTLKAEEVKLGEDGKVTKEYEEAFMSSFKKDCPDGFEKPQEGTGAPAHGNANGSGNDGGAVKKQSLADILREKRSI